MLIFIQVLMLNASVKDFYINIWSEYDHDGVLLMFNGVLTEDTELPVEIIIPVPEGTHQFLAMGTAPSAEQTVQLEATNGQIKLNIKHLNFQLEYYSHPYSGDINQFDYEFILPFDVQRNCDYFVQKPLAAIDFDANFEDYEIQNDRHGIEYFLKKLGPKIKGDKINIQFTYKNPDKKLSMDILRDMMASMGGSPQTQALNKTEQKADFPKWIWGLMLAIIILISLIAVLIKPSVNKDITQENPEIKITQDTNHKFCNKCGTPRETDHAFCSSCGNKFV